MTLLNRQRLLHVLERKNGKYFQISLREGFSRILNASRTIRDALVVVGKSQDLETLFSAKLWAKRWFSRVSFAQDFLENTSLFVSFFATKNQLMFNQKTFDESLYIFLVGTNLRYELPILNLKVKQSVRLKNTPVFTWGIATNFNYLTYNLGINFLNLNTLLKGKSIFSAFFLEKKGFWFLSPHVSHTTFLTYIKEYVNKFLQCTVYNVSAYNALVNMFAVSFASKNLGMVASNHPLVVNIQANDHILKRFNYSLYVFFGSHGY